MKQDELQEVYDLIISRCEHVPHWHKKGAAALRTINRLAREAEAFEGALRIRVWNQCRALGMSQDKAIAAVELEIERVPASVDERPQGHDPQGHGAKPASAVAAKTARRPDTVEWTETKE